jgi:hypothetical protein
LKSGLFTKDPDHFRKRTGSMKTHKPNRRKSMKAMIMAVIVAAAVAVTGLGLQQAEARGIGYKGDSPRHMHKMDEATLAKIKKFKDDTRDLRKTIAMKRAEESALIRNENPDIQAVKKAAGELFDLKSTLREKAMSAGLFATMHHETKDGKHEELHVKFVKFFADTKDLRKQIAEDKAAERAILDSRNPDPQAASKLAGEIFDLRSSLHDKALAAGLPHFHRMSHGKRFHHHHNYDKMD